jgi:quinoprotein glucose dehydrogenase
MKRSNMRLIVMATAVAVLVAGLSQVEKAQRGVRPPARNPDADWPMYNRDLAGTRYSPLTQINANNVSTLKLAWSFRLPPETPLPASRTPSATEVFRRLRRSSSMASCTCRRVVA